MSLKAGVVQFSPLYGRVGENLGRLELLVEDSVRRGAKVLVLPEMAWTGYLWPDAPSVRPWAETAGSGPGQDTMRDWSLRWDLTLIYGFPEWAGGDLFNSQGIASPDGAVNPVYRKTHLFDADHWWAQPGDTGYLQWSSPWGPIGSGVCMDLNYPDLADHHRRMGTSILAFSTNWIDEGFDVVPYWLNQLGGSDRAGYQGLALFADRGGQEFGVNYRGQSSIFQRGQCLATLPGKEDGVLIMEVDVDPPD